MSVRRPRPTGDESGFTLIELMVAMLITAMVLAMAGAFFVNVSKLTAAARVSRESLGQAELAVDAVRSVVTMAADNPTSNLSTSTTPAVVAGTGTSLTVVSFANTTATAVAPSLVTFSIDGSGYLTQTQQVGVIASTGYWAFTGTTTSRRIGGPYITGSGTPFFSYVNTTGSLLSAGSAGLVTADLSKVAFVRVTAKVAARTSAGAADPVVITSSIGLTNVYRDVANSVTIPTLTGGQ